MIRTGETRRYEEAELLPEVKAAQAQTNLMASVLAELANPMILKQADESAAAQEAATMQAIEGYEAETHALMGLGNAPLGVLTIAGAAMMALGWSSRGAGMGLFRWLGGATLIASGVIAVRRATASV